MEQKASVINAKPMLYLDGSYHSGLSEAVLEIETNQPIHGRSHAEIMLLNWGRKTTTGEANYLWQDIALGSTLAVSFGSEARNTQFTGEITAIEERYSSDSDHHKLVMIIEDQMHRLARYYKARVFEDVSADNVVEILANDVGLAADISVSDLKTSWYQLNESNYAFLSSLCRKWDVCARIDGDTLRVRPEEYQDKAIELSPQNTQYIRIIADLNHQPSQTRMLNWDLENNIQIDEKEQSLSSMPSGQTAAQLLQELGWSTEEVVTCPRPSNSGFAGEWSKAAYQRQARRFLHGDIICEGNTELLVGGEIELIRVSPRLMGKYRITHCSHRFDSQQGYITQIQVEKPDWRESAT